MLPDRLYGLTGYPASFRDNLDLTSGHESLNFVCGRYFFVRSGEFHGPLQAEAYIYEELSGLNRRLFLRTKSY